MEARSIKTQPSISKDTIAFRHKTVYALYLIIFFATGEASKKQVCIVGAGVSGLIAAKYFGEFPNEFEPIVFEKNSDVGGLWIYTNSTTVDEHGLPVHSGIYKNLKTNVPKGMMTLPDYLDFKGQADDDGFVRHEDVLQYLKNFTDHFNLRQYIRFNTNVVKVKLVRDFKWFFVAKNLDTDTTIETVCDAAVICNGHNVKGHIPKITGIKTFAGQTLHSHVYREPSIFVNQTVVILGAAYSGIDISVDISSTAKKVYLSHRHDKLPDVFPPNVEEVPGVVAAEGSELILSNGTKIHADTLVLCTGYVYDFPFLDKSSGIVVEEGNYIRPIYNHLININHPTMAIVNVPRRSLSFQAPHVQVNYFRAVLRNKLELPSREQMLMEARLPPNVPKNKAHNFPYDQLFSYLDELVLASGGKPLPWWFAPVTDEIEKLIYNDPVNYRDKRLVIHEDGRIEFV